MEDLFTAGDWAIANGLVKQEGMIAFCNDQPGSLYTSTQWQERWECHLVWLAHQTQSTP